MPTITYQNTSIQIEEPQTVLEGLEEAGFSIPFSCRSGICHSCLMQAEQRPPPTAQRGLTDNQKAQDLFLACSCIPQHDMQVNLIGDTTKKPALLIDKKPLNNTVMALFLQSDYRWFPGQYLTLWYKPSADAEETEGRSYSIASRCEQDKIIELHIKRHEYGLVSTWLHDQLEVGQSVNISKPMGDCFYSDDHRNKPILMASTGTGLAPLFGVLQEALYQQHDRPIYLYSAAGEPDGLYYRNELSRIANTHSNVYYIPAVRRNANDDDSIIEKDIVDLVKERHSDLKNWKVFLCGNEDMIKQLQRHCFFQGATVNDILVDVFVVDKPNT